jgi:alpha-L-fucosidase 2
MKIPLLPLLLLSQLCAATDAKSPLVLWYKQPATIWNEALPIGNGRLGAMVFGGVANEHLQLNEDTVWAGEKRTEITRRDQRTSPK